MLLIEAFSRVMPNGDSIARLLIDKGLVPIYYMNKMAEYVEKVVFSLSDFIPGCERQKVELEFTETFEPLSLPISSYVYTHLWPMSGMEVVQPHGAALFSSYKTHHPHHLAYPCKATDIWVVSHPKAGTTWTQEIVWHLVRGFEHKDSKKVLMDRFPLFEYDSLCSPLTNFILHLLPVRASEKPGMQRKLLDNQEDPRMVKTHLHLPLLPREITSKGSKMIYIMRDPRDVCISLYYHSQRLLNYSGDFDHFVQIFLQGAWMYSPYWPHVLGYWKASKENKNILLLRYEEMKEDLPGNVKKIADFLGLSPSEQEVQRIAESLTFEAMKKNPITNNESMTDRPGIRRDINFCRKGVVGDYKTHLTQEHLRQFKRWTEHWLQDSDFPYYRDYDC